MNRKNPSVTVIVPVKDRPSTIRDAVESLLRQDYKGEYDVVLIGDVNDPTWGAISDLVDDTHLRKIEVVVPARIIGQDASYKRNFGVEASTGTILAFTDSDAIVPTHWLRTGVTELYRAASRSPQTQAVSGLIMSYNQGFWERYVDHNVFAGKTPRIEQSYITNKQGFGVGQKPPVTGNLFVTRSAFKDAGGFNDMTNWYDDYEFAWRLCSAGYAILHVPGEKMTVLHNHRQGLGLFREYLRDGRACARFMNSHRDCPFAKQRRRQVRLVQGGLAAFVGLGLVSVISPLPLAVGSVAIVAGLSCLAILEAWKTQRLDALTYPFLSLVLGLLFSYGITDELGKVSAETAGAEPGLQAH